MDPCLGVVCEDCNPCTVDVCLEDGSCGAFAVSDGAKCGPIGACGQMKCSGGLCQGDPCDDGNPCTADSCGECGVCIHEPLSDGTECWTASLCAVNAACLGGYCVAGAEADCADGDPATTDTCDPELSCQQLPGANHQPAMVARGATSTFVKMLDSTVWQVGNVDANRLVRVNVAGGGPFDGVLRISAGHTHTHALAVKSMDGSVWAWGLNVAGELGNGTNQSSGTPVEVTVAPNTPLVGCSDVAAGGDTSYALGSDGKVRSWGINHMGQLGDGSRTHRNRAVLVQRVNGGDLANITAISAAHLGGLALRDDGTVWAWGANGGGECGDEAFRPWATRAGRIRTVAGAFLNDVTAIAGGRFASIALRSDGTVWAWGDDRGGQLGDSSGGIRERAGQVPGLTEVAEIAAGDQFFFVRKQDGSVWAWGKVEGGRLGNGRADAEGAQSIERARVRVFRPGNQALSALALSQGPTGAHGGVLNDQGFGVWMWGKNHRGQLADGTRQDRLRPVEMLPP